jgi:hypothetical protein
LAHAQIALHVSPPLQNAVRQESDLKRAWELRRMDRFGTRMALRRELMGMRKDPGRPMTIWIASVREVARRIKEILSS